MNKQSRNAGFNKQDTTMNGIDYQLTSKDGN